ncbi:hypothetical protein [Rhodocaloribacter sp.]
MKKGLFAILLLFACVLPASAQERPIPETVRLKSPRKAFAMSLLFPGLGHRYAQNGRWGGGGSLFAFADAGLWLGLIGTEWRRNSLVQSFETLAATRAHAQVEGKGRTFFLNLAAFHSSEEYLEVQLRNRAWDQLDYVSERAFQWAWETEEDFQKFRRLRSDSETLRNRRFVFIAALVSNRIIAGLFAVRAANRTNGAANLSVTLGPPPPDASLPRLDLRLTF